MDALFNLLLGIVGSLIAAVIFEILRANSDWFPGPAAPSRPHAPIEDEFDERARNREKFKIFTFNVLFYFSTFYLTYAAITLPITVKAMFGKTPVLLDQARLIGEYLPPIEFTKDVVQVSLMLVALVIYFPILWIVGGLATAIYPAVDKFWRVDIYVWRRIQLFIFAVFCAALAVLTIWAFYELTLAQAATNFLAVMGLGAFFTLGQKR
ncbi:TPA: hypothetical protein QDC06_003020 [Burkholderia cepacia]|nr:hypothetical protein [Burkholderia cepacia]